ncbi:hypothetical protein ACFOY8_12065 [Thalassospira xianhensis]|uniref:Plasmid replication protein n=1 Tax=Thalassospira xianhensis MCCC 1A02616 TaxID=1177929 RepID=A0A367UAW0_9PROT|nr:hypothetical protein [Thalassospira xianhensis]RCK04162.1 hypothetical protein TH5_21560 [Thalassospira xianhensis MCCC 1A02616]
MEQSATLPIAKPQLQLSLWPVSDVSQTNMVALYDLAPRFVFDVRSEESKRKVIERTFEFGGKRYRITLKPTQMQNGSEVDDIKDRYLGEREGIVEEVIRRIASDRSRLTLHDGDKVRFVFSLNEVRKELKRVNHTFSLDEIREAIVLLHEVRIRIEDVDGKKSPLLYAPAFPVVAMRKKDDSPDMETYVQFNPLVADSIRSLNFQPVSYERLMEIRDPVARWLVKRLHAQISVTGESVQSMLATEIRRDSGMPEWKTTRNLLRRVSQSVQVLESNGILERVEAEEHLVGQRKVDITFTMKVSDAFMEEVTASVKERARNHQTFHEITGGQDPKEGFVEIDRTTAFKLRADRMKSAEVIDLPLQAIAAG